MDDPKKMLQAIINGQSAMKSELLIKIDRLDKKVDNLEKKLTSNIDSLRKETKAGFDKLTGRVDKIDLTSTSISSASAALNRGGSVVSRYLLAASYH